jgi:hypothetical protein
LVPSAFGSPTPLPRWQRNSYFLGIDFRILAWVDRIIK